MKHISFAFLVFSIAVSVFATIPPALAPGHIPPISLPDHPQTLLPHVVAVPDTEGPLTLARIENAHLSSPLYYALKRLLVKPAAAATPPLSTAADDGAVVRAAGQSRLFIPAPLLTGETPANVTDGWVLTDNQDAEPTVIALDRTVNQVTYTNTITAAMTYEPHTFTANIFAHSSSSVPPANFKHTELPIPADVNGNPEYNNTGDPLLAANVYGSGVWPKRVYCSGMLFSATGDTGTFYLPSAIGLWHSDDGGQAWSAPSGVAWQNGGGLITDKPSIAVSYHSGTLGYVYVSWTVRDTRSGQGANSQLWVSRSKDGGATFEQPVVVTWDNVNDSALAVDSNTGTVYIVWVNFRFGDIRVAQSIGTSPALAFGAHSIVSSGGLVTFVAGGLRAPTVPMARYNWIANRLMVMWHGVNSQTQGIDIFYSFYPCTSECNTYGWQTVPEAQDKTRDQFQPGFDYDRYGDVVASFYSRRDDSSNILYYEYVTKFHADGTSVTGVNDVRVSWQCSPGVTDCAADPTYSNGNTVDGNFVGDYEDAWIWTYPDGDKLVSSFIRIARDLAKIGDVYVGRTTP